MLLQVKRGIDSIAQYLHESSSVSIRPYQVSQADYYYPTSYSSGSDSDTFGDGIKSSEKDDELSAAAAARTGRELGDHYESNGSFVDKITRLNFRQPTVTLYDITLIATVALNVSLTSSSGQQQQSNNLSPTAGEPRSFGFGYGPSQQQAGGVNTILNFRRGQRMTFECQLEITGTDYEKRNWISINEEGE